MKVPVIYANVVNLNGRLYNINSIQKIISIFENKDGELFGNIGYPDVDNFTLIPLSNVSHSIKNLIYDDNILFAEIKVLDTPNGLILKDNIHNYVFRPRLIGNILDNNIVNVEKLITFDAVLKETDAFNTEECKHMLDNYNLK